MFSCSWTINIKNTLPLSAGLCWYGCAYSLILQDIRCKESSLLRRPILPPPPAAAQPSTVFAQRAPTAHFSCASNGPCHLCSTYKPLLRQMLSCPARWSGALQHCAPVAGSGRTWKHSKHCCMLRPSRVTRTFTPQPFFSNPRWVLPHCRCHSENCDAEYFLALDLVQASCILLRLRQGRH